MKPKALYVIRDTTDPANPATVNYCYNIAAAVAHLTEYRTLSIIHRGKRLELIEVRNGKEKVLTI